MASLMSTYFLTVCVGYLHASPSYRPLTEYKIDTWCTKSANLTEPIVLQSRDWESTVSPNVTCEIRIKVPPDHRIIISFLFLKDELNGLICNNSLHLYNGAVPGNYSPNTEGPCFAVSSDYGVTSTAEEISIHLYDNSNSSIHRLVDLLLIPFHTGTCGSNEYRCSNGRCIDSSLRCNHMYNSCGNDDCTPSYVSPPSLHIFVCGVLLIFFGIVACCCFWCLRRKRRRERRRQQRHASRGRNPEAHEGGTSHPHISILTAPAYTPPCAPPPYSTLPKIHNNEASNTKEPSEIFHVRDVTPGQNDNPPPYDP